MENFVFDLFSRLSSIVIITMLLVVVKVNIHNISAPCGMIRKAWKTLLSPAICFSDRLSHNSFLYQLFSGSKSPHRHVSVILRCCVCADHSLAGASGRHGHELRFRIFE
jgi:hypothetical protein